MGTPPGTWLARPSPTRGRYWLNEDNKPPTAWPTPPPPSTDRSEGAYFGAHGTEDDEPRVTVTDAQGTRPLYHHVGHSPTGYSPRQSLPCRRQLCQPGRAHGIVPRKPDEPMLEFCGSYGGRQIDTFAHPGAPEMNSLRHPRLA